MKWKCNNRYCGWKGDTFQAIEYRGMDSNRYHCPACGNQVTIDQEASKIQEEKERMELYPVFQFFSYSHLPDNLKNVSKPIAELAEKFLSEIPEGPEKAAGFRKLLEAKDCFVRASLNK